MTKTQAEDMMEIDTFEAPAFLAEAIFYGEDSSFDEAGRDEALLQDVYAYVAENWPSGRIVSCEPFDEYRNLRPLFNYTGATAIYTVLY